MLLLLPPLIHTSSVLYPLLKQRGLRGQTPSKILRIVLLLDGGVLNLDVFSCSGSRSVDIKLTCLHLQLSTGLLATVLMYAMLINQVGNLNIFSN